MNTLIHSVRVLSPMSDVLSPPNILLAAIGTPLWKKVTISMKTDLKTATDTHTHTHYCALVLLTSAAADHLLTSTDVPQNGLLQSRFHVLGLLKCQTVDPLQGFLPLRQPLNMKQSQCSKNYKKRVKAQGYYSLETTMAARDACLHVNINDM